ncbi:MAG TPA: hypothetical protein VIN10_01240 [Bacteroidales bacterium]
MKTIEKREFNSKILLFGEYSILCGSMALSVPFEKFKGLLCFPEKEPLSANDKISNEQIKEFLEFIKILNQENQLQWEFDTWRLSKDVEAGLLFKSNIPIGYGLGSSGALVAALCNTYCESVPGSKEISSEKLQEMKSFFSILESFFHGKSSGLDPLVSFLNQAVLVSGNNKIEAYLNDREDDERGGAVFLIDSGKSGKTQDLVNDFRKKCEIDSFKKNLENHLIPSVNSAILSFKASDKGKLFSEIEKISEFQLNNFSRMVPDSVTKIWQEGLNGKRYFLKLCGSGGGGMMLGFTTDFAEVKMQLSDFKPIRVQNL